MSLDDLPDIGLKFSLPHQGRNDLIANLDPVVVVEGGRTEPDLYHVGEDLVEAENGPDSSRRRLEIFVVDGFGADGDEQLDDLGVRAQLATGIGIGRHNFEKNQLLEKINMSIVQ